MVLKILDPIYFNILQRLKLYFIYILSLPIYFKLLLNNVTHHRNQRLLIITISQIKSAQIENNATGSFVGDKKKVPISRFTPTNWNAKEYLILKLNRFCELAKRTRKTTRLLLHLVCQQRHFANKV